MRGTHGLLKGDVIEGDLILVEGDHRLLISLPGEYSEPRGRMAI